MAAPDTRNGARIWSPERRKSPRNWKRFSECGIVLVHERIGTHCAPSGDRLDGYRAALRSTKRRRTNCPADLRLHRPDRRLHRARARHVDGIVDGERLVAEGRDDAAVVEALDLDISRYRHFGGEIGGQIGQPADARPKEPALSGLRICNLTVTLGDAAPASRPARSASGRHSASSPRSFRAAARCAARAS